MTTSTRDGPNSKRSFPDSTAVAQASRIESKFTVNTASHSPAHYALKPGAHSSHSALLALLPAPGNGRRVLDIGCGTGELASLLGARGYEVTGIERVPIENPSFELIIANIEDGLPALKGAFDAVICGDVLEHLTHPARLLREIHSVLTPAGRLIASLPNSGHYYFRANILAGRFPQHEKGLFDRTHLRFFMWDGWQELFAGAGFRFVSVAPTIPPFELQFPALKGSLLLRVIDSANYAFARLRMQLFAYQFVVEAAPEKART